MHEETAADQYSAYWREANAGSAHHYWHFLFGYFLPLMRRLTPAHPRPRRARLYDCGPLMNRILIEALARLDIRPEFDAGLISEAAEPATNPAGAATVMDRWDLWLKHGDGALAQKPLTEAAEFAAGLLSAWPCCNPRNARDSVLIIRRSPEPSFYKPGGGAVIERYGAGRRSFEHVDEGADELNARGVRSIVYEPGLHNLACQINHFSRCGAVVGVRGAEFANILWAPRSARIIMFMSSSIPNDRPPPRILAALLGQPFFDIPHEGAASPTLDVEKVMQILSGQVRPAAEIT